MDHPCQGQDESKDQQPDQGDHHSAHLKRDHGVRDSRERLAPEKGRNILDEKGTPKGHQNGGNKNLRFCPAPYRPDEELLKEEAKGEKYRDDRKDDEKGFMPKRA